MKIILATCLCAAALACTAFGQDPTPTLAPAATAVPAATPVAVVTPAAAATASPSLEQTLEEQIEKKVKKGLNITFGDDDEKDGAKDEDRGAKRRSSRHRDFDFGDDDNSWLAIPIVGVVFLTVFGTPVMIVALIMYFSMSKTRAMHRTVRMMVEKGQEVPAALLNPPPAVRQRSDMRRGIVLVTVGLGCMLFFAAVNEWEGGAWAIGIIPFLIGCGYLLVWKLEAAKAGTDKLPPVS